MLFGLVFHCASSLAFAATDYEIKAAYLYNFVKFVHWNKTSQAENKILNLCILGDHPFRSVLSPLKNKTVQNRKLNITYLDKGNEIESCQIVYVSESERKNLHTILAMAKSLGILTVSDIKGFAREGGIIGFLLVGNVIRFEINLGEAQQADIKISSKLLEIAEDVMR